MSGLFHDEPAEDPPLPDVAPEGPGLFGDAPPPPPPATAAAAPYRVLARKYRPVSFDDMIGQEAMVRTLRQAFALGRIAHAFMLTGVRGVGKTTTARIIARALNCVGADGTGGPTPDPCGVCPNCVAILADRHPDVQEMDAASRTGIDDVREIIEATRFRPMQARTKVFIVDEVHMLSRPAFNALLKTLEEPPGHVKFIFATTELRKVPVTVLSRCQRFDLRRIPQAALAAHFAGIADKEGARVSAQAMALIARAADGSARDGLSLLDQAIAAAGPDAAVEEAAVADMLGLADRLTVFDLFEAVMAGRPADALALVGRAHAHGADAGMLLQDLLELVHTVTRLKAVPDLAESQDLPEAERNRGAALAGRLSLAQLGRAWQMLLKGVAEVEAAPDRRAAAEMVLIRLCHAADLPTPGELVRRLSEGGSNGTAQPGPAPGAGPTGRPRAVVNGPPVAVAAVAAEASPASFREAALLVQRRREAILHGHLVHSVHAVRFVAATPASPGVIELRPDPDAPRDLAARFAAVLQEATGLRWTIALSTAEGDKTLAAQGMDADAARRQSAALHPLVRAIMEAFPGARIQSVHDAAADAYGLPAEPGMPEFAPDHAEPAEDLPDEWES